MRVSVEKICERYETTKREAGGDVAAHVRAILEAVKAAACPACADGICSAHHPTDPPDIAQGRHLRMLQAQIGEAWAVLKDALGGDTFFRNEGVHWPVPITELAKAAAKKLERQSWPHGVVDVQGSDQPSGGWEPQQHGEPGDWALPDKEGEARPFVTRLPDGSVSLHLDYKGHSILSRQFTPEEWKGLLAIASGRAKLWCQKV